MVQRVALQTLFKSKPCRIGTPASGEASDATVGLKFILQSASWGFQHLPDDGADSLAPNLISEWQDEWKIRQELVQCRYVEEIWGIKYTGDEFLSIKQCYKLETHLQLSNCTFEHLCTWPLRSGGVLARMWQCTPTQGV